MATRHGASLCVHIRHRIHRGLDDHLLYTQFHTDDTRVSTSITGPNEAWRLRERYASSAVKEGEKRKEYGSETSRQFFQNPCSSLQSRLLAINSQLRSLFDLSCLAFNFLVFYRAIAFSRQKNFSLSDKKFLCNELQYFPCKPG